MGAVFYLFRQVNLLGSNYGYFENFISNISTGIEEAKTWRHVNER